MLRWRMALTDCASRRKRVTASLSRESADRYNKGETLTSEDAYVVTAPVLQTSSERYAWLNQVQCVGRVVQMKGGENRFVKYDIFIVR